MEKRTRSSHIVILTAISCLLIACVISSPALLTGGGSRNGDYAAEASILAERYLDRAMEEMKRTGSYSAEDQTLSFEEDCGAVYRIDTRIVRRPTGEASRVSVRVKWKGPLSGGAVVATGICGENTGYDRAAMSGELAKNYPADIGEVDIGEADKELLRSEKLADSE